MVRNLHRPDPLHKEETMRLRAEAGQLLRRLLANREASERRHAETGRRDPIKSVTGLSALDEAIASTRDMISHMDALITDLEEVVEEEERACTARRDQPITVGSES